MQRQPSSSSLTRQLNKYWIPTVDIHRQIITTQIQFYLGPNSTARSFSKNGTEGYLIATPGECLTDNQIDDICRKSLELYKTQAEARMTAADRMRGLLRPLHVPIVIYKNRNSTSGGSGRNSLFGTDDDRGTGNNTGGGRRSYYRGSIDGGDASAGDNGSSSNNTEYRSYYGHYRSEPYGQSASFAPLPSSEPSAAPTPSMALESDANMAFANQSYYYQGYRDPRY